MDSGAAGAPSGLTVHTRYLEPKLLEHCQLNYILSILKKQDTHDGKAKCLFRHGPPRRKDNEIGNVHT